MPQRVGKWLEKMRDALVGSRYSDVYTTLAAAWDLRNKTHHSDAGHVVSNLPRNVADQSISTILQAINRSYQVFVKGGVTLSPSASKPPSPAADRDKPGTASHKVHGVNREELRAQLKADGYSFKEPKDHHWLIDEGERLTVRAPKGKEGMVVIRGTETEKFCNKYAEFLSPSPSTPVALTTWIGVDESGKGDLFGPLVVAAVALTSELEDQLRQAGVKDGKKLKPAEITRLAQIIDERCSVEREVLPPLRYNEAYKEHGQNLNHLLAFYHVQVIHKLSQRAGTTRAVSDQFGKKELLEDQIARLGLALSLEQRPQAEDDMAVAAASIVARAAFLASLDEYSQETGIEIPRGSSDTRVKEVARAILHKWGREGLRRFTKFHFKQIDEILKEESDEWGGTSHL